MPNYDRFEFRPEGLPGVVSFWCFVGDYVATVVQQPNDDSHVAMMMWELYQDHFFRPRVDDPHYV